MGERSRPRRHAIKTTVSRAPLQLWVIHNLASTMFRTLYGLRTCSVLLLFLTTCRPDLTASSIATFSPSINKDNLTPSAFQISAEQNEANNSFITSPRVPNELYFPQRRLKSQEHYTTSTNNQKSDFKSTLQSVSNSNHNKSAVFSNSPVLNVKILPKISSSYKEANFKFKNKPANETVNKLFKNIHMANFHLNYFARNYSKMTSVFRTNGLPLTENTSNGLHNVTDERILAISKASWPVKIFNCIRSLNIIHCLKIFILQRANEAIIRSNNNNETVTESWFEDLLSESENSPENFSTYENLTNHQLDEQIIESLYKVFDKRVLRFHFLPGITVRVTPSSNSTVNLAVYLEDLPPDVAARKMRVKISDLYPFMLLPPLLMAGILPMMLPGIKMAVMFVAMLNQMAFMSALFALIRGFIFDPRPADQIVYVNKGYANDPQHDVHGGGQAQFMGMPLSIIRIHEWR